MFPSQALLTGSSTPSDQAARGIWFSDRCIDVHDVQYGFKLDAAICTGKSLWCYWGNDEALEMGCLLWSHELYHCFYRKINYWWRLGDIFTYIFCIHEMGFDSYYLRLCSHIFIVAFLRLRTSRIEGETYISSFACRVSLPTLYWTEKCWGLCFNHTTAGRVFNYLRGVMLLVRVGSSVSDRTTPSFLIILWLSSIVRMVFLVTDFWIFPSTACWPGKAFLLMPKMRHEKPANQFSCSTASPRFTCLYFGASVSACSRQRILPFYWAVWVGHGYRFLAFQPSVKVIERKYICDECSLLYIFG